MRKRLMVALLMVFLSVTPAFAGHSVSGGFGWCECTPVQGYCPCCGGELLAAANDQESDSISQHDTDGAELNVVRLAFLMWLKLKA